MGARRFPHERLWASAFVAPPIAGFVVFGLGPAIASFALGFARWDLLGTPSFAGLANYRRLFFDDPFVGRALANTALYLAGVPLGVAASLAIALLLDRVTLLRGLLRTVYFVPSVCSIVAVALVWKWIYRADYGLLNMALSALGVRNPPAWLGEPSLVKPSLVFMGVWTSLGFDVIVFLAALQNVPRYLLEAAELDGANAWQRFRHVVFPAVSPTIFFVAVTSTIATLQSFDRVWVMTRGGPSYGSATLMLHVYTTAFQYFDMGYASALAWVLAALVLAVTWAQFALAKTWVRE
jgi:multiple sugar transport system permease protein